MPRIAKPPHIVWIASQYHPDGRLKARGYFAIKHGPRLISTKISAEHRDEVEDQREEAEKIRHAYEQEVFAKRVRTLQGRSVYEAIIGDMIAIYLERNAARIEAKSRDRKRDYFQSVDRLINFWGDKTVADITEDTCEEYRMKARPGKPLSEVVARRELQDLKAMVYFGIKKGLCALQGHIIDWELPEAPDARATFYSEKDVADLVRAAYRETNFAIGGRKGHKTSLHLVRFMLIAVHTGTRAEKIEMATYEDVDDRPWMDLENGIFYRSGVKNKSPLNKRADPVRIPDRLLHQLRRWKKQAAEKGSINVIEFNGEPGSTKRAFYNLKKRVFSEARSKEVNRHTFKHTCASWLMKQRVPIEIIANYLSTTEEVIKKHYGHFHPDFHAEVNDSAVAHRAEVARKRKAAKAVKKAA